MKAMGVPFALVSIAAAGWLAVALAKRFTAPLPVVIKAAARVEVSAACHTPLSRVMYNWGCH